MPAHPHAVAARRGVARKYQHVYLYHRCVYMSHSYHRHMLHIYTSL